MDEKPVSRMMMVILLEGEICHICVCRHCRRYTDLEIIDQWGDFDWSYRRVKRQNRMRRKKRRGWI